MAFQTGRNQIGNGINRSALAWFYAFCSAAGLALGLVTGIR
ncbi:hypothetical protein TA3x_000431 [Tundrisphaera sp. TA3]